MCKKIIIISCLFFVVSCTKNTIVTNPKPTNSSDTITYSKNIKSILDNNCIVCHGGESPQAGFKLETYTEVKNIIENQNLIGRINNEASPMPPSGLMSVKNRQLIQEWLDDGLIE